MYARQDGRHVHGGWDGPNAADAPRRRVRSNHTPAMQHASTAAQAARALESTQTDDTWYTRDLKMQGMKGDVCMGGETGRVPLQQGGVGFVSTMRLPRSMRNRQQWHP